MLISELTVYDFLKDKIKLSDSDAKRYAKEIASVGEKVDTKIEEEVSRKFKESDYITKEYFRLELDARFSKNEAKMEKGFKEVVFWMISAMVGLIGVAVAIIKLF